MGNKVIKKLPVFLILLFFVVLMYGDGAVFAQNLNSHHQVIELNVDNRPYPKAIPYENTWIDRNGHFAGSFAILYSAEVIPGENYTLGFTCPAANRNAALTLFDRWPYSHGVKRINCPWAPMSGQKAKHLNIAGAWAFHLKAAAHFYILPLLCALRI